MKLNADFLLRHGTMLGDPTLRFQQSNLDQGEKEAFVGRIQAFLAECPPGPVLVIKEQCITDLLEFWIEGANRAGFSPKILIPVRHPGEVFASIRAIARRPDVTVEFVNAMWLKYNLLAERCSRDVPRAFVKYSNLMSDWRTEVVRVAKALSIKLDVENSSVDDFIAKDLYRQRCSEAPITETYAHSWVSQVYSILSIAAEDGVADVSVLNAVYDAYRLNERTFRMSWDWFRTGFDPHKQRLNHELLSTWKSGRDF